MSIATIGILGSLRVRDAHGTPIEPGAFRTSKTRHLLRLLALSDGDAIRASELVEVLWPAVPEPRGRASLRTAACQLRHELGSAHVERVGDALRLRRAEVDSVLFEREAQRAHHHFLARNPVEGLAVARSALERFRGDLADDEPFLDPILRARARIARIHDELLLEATSAALEVGRVHEGVDLATRALERDGSCERASRLLMHAYARLAEPSMALRVYDRCRRAIAEELGIAPAPQTQALYLSLLDDRGQVPAVA